ncbi:MAG: DUF58 domain-containing protein [Gammaproteobacteria bacterium]|nr:DUF58 domain-containing protein [Gammaproteobacteria bacterium]
MRPSRHLLILLLLWAGIGLLATVARLAAWPISLPINFLFWIYFALLSMIMLIDGFAGRSAPELKVTRKLDPYLALGVQQSVSIRLTNQSDRLLPLWLSDSPPSQLQLEGLPHQISVKPNEFVDIHYQVTPVQRGMARFGRVCCRILSPWKLWQKKFYFCEPEQTKIYPNYKPLFQSSFVNSEQLYSDWGIRLRQRRGEGTDFHQLRDFRVGDSLRQIDWRATARFNRPISREYQEERDQQVVFLLDCGRRMRAKDGNISHFDHALNALLLSAYIALRQGDSVGLLSFAGESRWVAPIKGQHQISHLLDQIYDLDSSLNTTDYLEVAQQLISRQPRRSLIVLISSLEPEDRDDLVKAARLLSQHHLVLIASMRQQVLTDAQHSDIESLDEALKFCGATHQMQKQTALHSQLRSDHIIVTDTQPSQMHIALIDEYMALKRSGVF